MKNTHLNTANKGLPIKYSLDCDEGLIFQFLSDVKLNNNREWFHANKNRYDEVYHAFKQIVERLISTLSGFDSSCSMISVESTLYRFYRDTRFSQDKSPYKLHFGSYINSKGRKSQHGGYYLHLQPGNCLIGGGAYCLEPSVLKAVRRAIVDDIDQFRSIVENPIFSNLFPTLGTEHLKTLPLGFPRDFEYPQYLRPKNYAVMHQLPDEFFFQKNWIEKAANYFQVMKPFLDFVNDIIDDYID